MSGPEGTEKTRLRMMQVVRLSLFACSSGSGGSASQAHGRPMMVAAHAALPACHEGPVLGIKYADVSSAKHILVCMARLIHALQLVAKRDDAG